MKIVRCLQDDGSFKKGEYFQVVETLGDELLLVNHIRLHKETKMPTVDWYPKQFFSEPEELTGVPPEPEVIEQPKEDNAGKLSAFVSGFKVLENYFRASTGEEETKIALRVDGATVTFFRKFEGGKLVKLDYIEENLEPALQLTKLEEEKLSILDKIKTLKDSLFNG